MQKSIHRGSYVYVAVLRLSLDDGRMDEIPRGIVACSDRLGRNVRHGYGVGSGLKYRRDPNAI